MTDSMLEGILERAIRSEESSYKLYTDLAARVEKTETRKLLEGLASQELTHKKLLEDFDLTQLKAVEPARIEEHKLSDFLEPTPLDRDATVQDVMLFAMRKEQSAYEFYSHLGEFSPSDAVKALFDRLAREELKHKTDLEAIYEDMFMREN
jgi:rubrerythrin